MLAGLVLLTAGALLNRAYLVELFAHRGAARRTEAGLDTTGQVRTERVVRRRAEPEGGAPDAKATPDAPRAPLGGERRAEPRGGDGPRRIR